MRAVSYVLMIAGFAWAGWLAANGGAMDDGAAAPAAALLAIGFGLWTTAGVKAGSIRGSNRRIRRDEQAGSFWTAVAIYYAIAAAMLLYSFIALTG